MAIRIRQVDGKTIAICAARSVPKEGDVYLDDSMHHALTNKFARDFNEMYKLDLPEDKGASELVEREESNNPNRNEWDRVYGGAD